MSEAWAGGPRGQGRVGTVINGKWQVDARIGSGGMATVYAATHRNGLRAALKMLHVQLSRDPQVRARFLREGYVANAVGHPGVVSVLDDGVTEDGAVFLVLELLEGETIDARRVRLGGALPIDEVLDLAEDALDVLAAAHEKGIVHRDVKPENVFLTSDGQIKLLDFGLARMKDAHSEATQTGVTIGTPEFMPPEQAAGRRDAVDARSDVWGLGATLYTAITGRYVHDDAQSIHEQLIASATRRSRPIRQLAPHVSPSVSSVIDRALELEMDDRWPSARDMQAALRSARGPRAEVFTADSMTVPVASLARAPGPSSLETEELGASDETLLLSPALSARDAVADEVGLAFDETQAAPALASDPAHGVRDRSLPPAPLATARMRGRMTSPSQPPDHFRGLMTSPSQPPPDHLRRPMTGSGSTSTSGGPPAIAGVTEPSRSRSSVRALVVVLLLALVACAAVGAYVLERSLGSHPP